jgi:hypothetical protein
MFLPEGLGGLLYMIRDRLLRYLAKRRNLEVPGLVARARTNEGADEGAVAVIAEISGGEAATAGVAPATARTAPQDQNSGDSFKPSVASEPVHAHEGGVGATGGGEAN